jgi:arylsulfatase A-like enzyme
VTPDRLNILFVTLDQLRADVVAGRLAGIAATPTLQRLAAEGVRFDQCFTATVPCGPSRASLLTGLYAFNHRAIRNGTPLARHHATVATEWRKLGREPLLFGYNDITADPTGRDLTDPDFASYEMPAAGFREILEMRFEAPLAWIGHLRARGYDLPAPLPDRAMDLYRPVPPDGRDPRPDDPLAIRAEDSETAFLTDRVIEALAARRDTVWTAHVTYIRPHPPLSAPAPWNRHVSPGDVPPPVAAQGPDHPFRHAWFSARTQAGLWHGFDGDCAGMDAGTVQTLRAVYLGLVAEVDHHLGRLLDWLDGAGLADRTAVLVMADHGEMLGDQGYWGKDTAAAAAHRVPLLIRMPGLPGGVVRNDLVSSVDIAPTLIDIAGGEPPPAMDGTSLLPLLSGGTPPGWRDAVLSEIDLAEPHAPTRFQTTLDLPEHRANAAVLRDRDWTLVHFNGGVPPMLFDRQADPDETRNLAGDPAQAPRVAAMRAQMLDLRMTRADRRLTGWHIG